MSAKCVEKILERLDEQRKRILGWADLAEKAEAIIAEEEFKALGAWVSIGHEIGSLQGILVMVNVKEAKEATPLLRRFRSLGLKITGHTDYAELQRRTYEFGVNLKVSLFFTKQADDGTVPPCRFVVVGTEQKPIYKLVCEDVEATEALDSEKLNAVGKEGA